MIDITKEKQNNGSLLLSTIYKGVFLKQVYYQYELVDAKKMFREYVEGVC